MARATLRLFSCSAFIPLALLAGCGSHPQSHPQDKTPAGSTGSDSLVATGENGLQIWFTMRRAGRAADGTSCVERALEIRRDGSRVPVPLLYTGTAPVLLDQSTMRAELWNHCRPVATYLV